MPIGFIAITIILLYLLFYKNGNAYNSSRVFIITLLLLTLSGYFIPDISIMNNFDLNVIFSFCVLILAFEFLFKVSNKLKGLVIICVIMTGLIYYALTIINNDYLTFFNYLPTFGLITLISLLFIKNHNAAVSFTLFSYFLVELLNYFIFGSSIGYLLLYSYVFINYIVYSLAIYFAIKLLISYLMKEKTKKTSEVHYEKK